MSRSTWVFAALFALSVAGPARAGFLLNTVTVGTAGRYTKTSGPSLPTGPNGVVPPYNQQLYIASGADPANALSNAFVIVPAVDVFNGLRAAGAIQIYDTTGAGITNFSTTPGVPPVPPGGTLQISVSGSYSDTNFAFFGVPELTPAGDDLYGTFDNYDLELTLTGVTGTVASGDFVVTGFSGISGTFSGQFTNGTFPTDSDPTLDGTYAFDLTIGPAFAPPIAAVPVPPAAALLGVGAAGLGLARRVRAARK